MPFAGGQVSKVELPAATGQFPRDPPVGRVADVELPRIL
jgi:hypothetical protein